MRTDYSLFHLPSLCDTITLQKISAQLSTPYIFLETGRKTVKISPQHIERMLQAADLTDAALLYSDYTENDGSQTVLCPTIEYQSGSVRDDFDFGTLLLYRSKIFQAAVRQMQEAYQYAALYDLRLKISLQGKIFRLPEPLYETTTADLRTSGEKQFDYVDPRNREVQIEMEKVCTRHLREAGAWLPPRTMDCSFADTPFQTEASVIIPVRNRVKTIEDAVQSALHQKAGFSFNIIVVDNYSTDGTTALLQKLAAQHPRLIHLTPAVPGSGIGGCWNEALFHPACGKFAIQLDSDDLYINDHVIQTLVDTFYEERCAMVIGSYKMVNFRLQEIPPGIIDHREWTPGNGHNNALRINGLGAPRAFYTPVLREIRFPDVSYGEDYAVALAISRKYKIGRIYEPLYLCRRWEDNSDATLNRSQFNTYNFYKDKIRTMEILIRQRQNEELSHH